MKILELYLKVKYCKVNKKAIYILQLALTIQGNYQKWTAYAKTTHTA
jgi:hypothetical protein